MGYTTSSHMAIFSAFAEVAAAIVGKSDDKKEVTEDLSKATPEHFVNRIAQLTSF